MSPSLTVSLPLQTTHSGRVPASRGAEVSDAAAAWRRAHGPVAAAGRAAAALAAGGVRLHAVAAVRPVRTGGHAAVSACAEAVCAPPRGRPARAYSMGRLCGGVGAASRVVVVAGVCASRQSPRRGCAPRGGGHREEAVCAVEKIFTHQQGHAAVVGAAAAHCRRAGVHALASAGAAPRGVSASAVVRNVVG